MPRAVENDCWEAPKTHHLSNDYIVFGQSSAHAAYRWIARDIISLSRQSEHAFNTMHCFSIYLKTIDRLQSIRKNLKTKPEKKKDLQDLNILKNPLIDSGALTLATELWARGC